MSVYSVGKRQQEVLRDEFETWKQAGFDGFDESFIKRPPTLVVMGVATNGVSYIIDLGPERVTVFEDAGGMVDGTRYARDATAADMRFRLFLSSCIEDRKLPKLASGKLPKKEF